MWKYHFSKNFKKICNDCSAYFSCIQQHRTNLTLVSQQVTPIMLNLKHKTPRLILSGLFFFCKSHFRL